jgi:hypothetical protein
VPVTWANVICWNIYSGKCGENSCRFVQIIINSGVFHLYFYGMEISELHELSVTEKGEILTLIFVNDTSF